MSEKAERIAPPGVLILWRSWILSGVGRALTGLRAEGARQADRFLLWLVVAFTAGAALFFCLAC